MSWLAKFWAWIVSIFSHPQPAPTPQPVPVPVPTPTPTGMPQPTPTPTGPTPIPVPTAQPQPLPPPRPSGSANIRICLGPNTLEGVDVSHDEPNTDWNQVAISGRKFAFAKATEGNTYADPDFAKNWRVGRAFLPMSPYHFFRANDLGSSQAKNFLSIVGKLNVGDLPAMLDVEIEGLTGTAPATCIVHMQAWLDAVEAATGKVPIIYTNDEAWNYLGNPTQFERYPLFVANIEAKCPSVPPPWSKVVFWQYSWTGRVPGIKVACDVDKFNGTAAQLDAFIRTGAIPS